MLSKGTTGTLPLRNGDSGVTEQPLRRADELDDVSLIKYLVKEVVVCRRGARICRLDVVLGSISSNIVPVRSSESSDRGVLHTSSGRSP